jgi:hypothetical protein
LVFPPQCHSIPADAASISIRVAEYPNWLFLKQKSCKVQYPNLIKVLYLLNINQLGDIGGLHAKMI